MDHDGGHPFGCCSLNSDCRLFSCHSLQLSFSGYASVIGHYFCYIRLYEKICLPVFLLVIPWFIRAQDTLDIRYDVNLETMAIIYNLSDAGSFLFEHNPPPRAMLARAITNRFSDLSDHEAVQWVNYLYEHDMVDLYDIDLSLYMTPTS